MTDLDKEAQEYFAALGKAIAMWQNVELQLGYTFFHASRSTHGFLIFDSILSTRDKIGALDTLLRAELRGSKLLTEWEALRNKLARMAPRRHKIVHAYTMLYVKNPHAPVQLPVTLNALEWEFLAGPGVSRSMLALDPVERLKTFRNVHQLKQLAKAFELLTGRVMKFSGALAAHITRPPA